MAKAKQTSEKPKEQTAKKPVNRWLRYGLLTLFTLIFMAACLGLWTKNNIYNSQQFAENIQSSLAQSSSRDAIAAEVTDKLYENRPIAQRLLSEPTKNTVSSLLATQRFENLTGKLAENLNKRMVRGNTQAIKIDISGFTSVASAIQQAVSPNTQINLPQGEAASITIVKENTLPNLKKPGQILLPLNPFLFLALIAGFIVSFVTYINKKQWLRDVGVVAIAASAILITFLYSISSYVSTFAANANQAILVQNVIDSFTGRLSSFLSNVLIVGILAWLIGYTWEKYNWPSKLWAGARTQAKKIRH